MKEVLPVEYGKRIKRARMAKNLTQKQLAKMANVSDSAISKYEKQGTLDVNVLNNLSNVLGISLFSSGADAEGNVGIVGKEILTILVKNEGSIEYWRLENELYGLSQDDIDSEIIKLSILGMIVREQYKILDGNLKDVIFIKAKGILSFKYLIENRLEVEETQELLKNVKSFEIYADGYDYYQDYIDNERARALIEKIDYVGTYRIDYIIYLKRRFPLNNQDRWEKLNLKKLNRIMPAKNIYYDIIFKMIFGLTNEKLWKIIQGRYLTGEWKYKQEYKELLRYNNMMRKNYACVDYVFNQANLDFYDEFPEYFEQYTGVDVEEEKREWHGEDFGIFESIPITYLHEICRYLIDPNDMYIYNGIDDSCSSKTMREREQCLSEIAHDFDDNILELFNAIHRRGYVDFLAKRVDEVFGDFEDENNVTYDDRSYHYLDTWFLDEEIISFINSNFQPAKTKEEKALDRVLKEINMLLPETLDYYKMPINWEENGIAGIIRKNYKLQNKQRENNEN